MLRGVSLVRLLGPVLSQHLKYAFWGSRRLCCHCLCLTCDMSSVRKWDMLQEKNLNKKKPLVGERSRRLEVQFNHWASPDIDRSDAPLKSRQTSLRGTDDLPNWLLWSRHSSSGYYLSAQVLVRLWTGLKMLHQRDGSGAALSW